MTKPRPEYRSSTGVRQPSVTTVIGAVLAKPALIEWAYRKGIEALGNELSAPPPYADHEETEQARAKWVEEASARAIEDRAHDRQRRGAANIGTVTHEMIKAHVSGEGAPSFPDADAETLDGARACFSRWLAWFVRNDPEKIAAEQSLVDDDLGYGGTFDFLCRIDGRVVLVDWKTGRDVYDDVVYQLGAYDNLVTKHGLTPTDGALVVNIPQDGDVQAIEVPTRQVAAGFAGFKSMLQIYKARADIKLNRGTK